MIEGASLDWLIVAIGALAAVAFVIAGAVAAARAGVSFARHLQRYPSLPLLRVIAESNANLARSSAGIASAPGYVRRARAAFATIDRARRDVASDVAALVRSFIRGAGPGPSSKGERTPGS